MVSLLNCSLFDEIFETEENNGHSSCFSQNDCEKIWDSFTQAFVGKDTCDVPPDAYDSLIHSVSQEPACNRVKIDHCFCIIIFYFITVTFTNEYYYYELCATFLLLDVILEQN